MFGRVIRPHHPYNVLLEVGLVNRPISPEDIIRHLQGFELAKPRELVLDRGQEDRIHGVYYMSLQGFAEGGSPLEQSLVFLESVHPECLFL